MLSNQKKKILERIFADVFSKINEQSVDVFLCGGASKRNYVSVRDSVRDKLKGKKNVRILYPEDLFVDLLNRNKEHDMLSLEKFLAQNSDMIFIVCESQGALVELGAFTNNKSTFSKVVAIVEKKHKKDKSFIMLGPIKMISAENKKNVLYYDKSDLTDLMKSLNTLFSSKRVNKIIANRSKSGRSSDSIIGLYHLIPLLVYFHSEVQSVDLASYIKYIFEFQSLTHSDREISVIFQAALKILYKEKIIRKTTKNKITIYSLTNVGYDTVQYTFKNMKIANYARLCDRIRFDIMYDKYY